MRLVLFSLLALASSCATTRAPSPGSQIVDASVTEVASCQLVANLVASERTPEHDRDTNEAALLDKLRDLAAEDGATHILLGEVEGTHDAKGHPCETCVKQSANAFLCE